MATGEAPGLWLANRVVFSRGRPETMGGDAPGCTGSSVAVACGALLHSSSTAVGRRTGVLHECGTCCSSRILTVYVTSFTTGHNTYRWGGPASSIEVSATLVYPIVAAIAATVHAVWPSVPEVIQGRRLAYLILSHGLGCDWGCALTDAHRAGIGRLEAVMLVNVGTPLAFRSGLRQHTRVVLAVGSRWPPCSASPPVLPEQRPSFRSELSARRR